MRAAGLDDGLLVVYGLVEISFGCVLLLGPALSRLSQPGGKADLAN